MGFNISGLAINKNYEDNFDELQKELGWNLKRKSEIDFETASSNWKEVGICDVYFTEKGTLLFLNMELCTQAWRLSKANTFTFALSEISMTFNIIYCENGVEKRSVVEFENNIMDAKGEKLEVEHKAEGLFDATWNQIEVMIGKRFWDIEPNEKAVRYIFSKVKSPEFEDENQKMKTDLKIKKNMKSRKWWQF